MGLPTSMRFQTLGRFLNAGITVEAYPSTVQGLRVEIQSATANSTASSVWASIILPPSSAGTLRHTLKLPMSTKTYYFRARHPAQPGYSAGVYTPAVSGQPVLIPDVHQRLGAQLTFSDNVAIQGSINPTPVSGIFSYNTNSGTAFAAVVWSWTARTIYLPNGTTIAIPASSTISVPAAPTLGQTAGGALGARTRFVRIAYIKNSSATSHRLYSVSAESSLLIAANFLLTITSPAAVAGYDGWCALIGTAANTEFTQGAGNVTVIAFGTGYTEPVGGATTAGTTPFATNWVGGVVEGYLGFSTTYYYYPYWDLAFAMQQPEHIGVIMSSDTPGSVATIAQAQGQISDGRIGLSMKVDGSAVIGYVKATTAAASGSGSGSDGGKF